MFYSNYLIGGCMIVLFILDLLVEKIADNPTNQLLQQSANNPMSDTSFSRNQTIARKSCNI